MEKNQVGEGTEFSYTVTIELIHPSFKNQTPLTDNNKGYTHLNILAFKCGVPDLVCDLTARSV